ncbi:MAG: hypothetical protein OEM77_07885 [Nitrosopumilus sp.]|nr:hypothetical protein [Nitrosopumilus sp.]MDH3823586.1 hypothetical protein [Nitrosopumilus sp.]MDH3833019.1 hypothetical protein [Nitrosopumilus sp.]
MAIEKWLAITSVGLFAMFAGEMISIYNFMIDVPENFEYVQIFSADPKILQFISIGVGPAGILAAVAYIMSKQYGSKPIGGMIVVGGIILLVGMYVCYSMLDKINDSYLTDAVKYVPILFMVLSAPVIGVGLYLTKLKKKRPKKEYF